MKRSAATAGTGGEPRWRTVLTDLFGIDLRSLALFRIALGLGILADLATRATDLEAHYTDFGLLPRTALLTVVDPRNLPFSLHLASGELWFQAALFLLAAFLALWVVVGYQTKVAVGLSYLLAVSLQARNPLILDGGDAILRLLLFWSFFLPVSAVWSVDRLRGRAWGADAPPGGRHLSVATLAILLQVAFVYVFGALIKSHDVWWREGSGVYYAFHVGQFATPFARFLLNFPPLVVWLSRAVYLLEMVGPLFGFVPFWRGPVRTLVAFVFMQLHLVGMGLVLELGVFPLIAAVGWTLYLPTWFWDAFAAPRREKFLASPAGQRLTAAAARFARWSGLTDLSRPPAPTPAVETPVAPPAAPGPRYARLVPQAVAGFFLAFVFLWNVRSTDYRRFQPLLPAYWDEFGRVTQLQQYWDMFAPWPVKDSGWFVIPAELADGSQMDLWTGGPVSWKRPPLVSATYRNARWRKYSFTLYFGNPDLRLHYGRYLTRLWNRRLPPGRRVVRFDIYLNRDRTQPGFRPTQFDQTVVWHHESLK